MFIGPNQYAIDQYIAATLPQSVFFFDPFNGASFGGTPADGTPIASFTERYGRTAWDLSQASSTSRPLYKTNSGKPYLLYDGVDDVLFTAAVNSASYFASSALTAIMMLFYTGPADGNTKVAVKYLGATDPSRLLSISVIGTTNNFLIDSGGNQTSKSSVFSTFKSCSVARSVGTSTKNISVNGVIEGSPQNASAVSTASDNMYVGAYSNAVNLQFTGGIGEFIMFNTRLTDYQVNIISRYFMQRRGL